MRGVARVLLLTLLCARLLNYPLLALVFRKNDGESGSRRSGSFIKLLKTILIVFVQKTQDQSNTSDVKLFMWQLS